MQNPAVVFDLDETLVYASSIKPKSDSYQIRVGRRRMHIQFRPGLIQFINEVSQFFEIFFFTASNAEYANQIINLISPNTPVTHRFFRDKCTSQSGYPVKDLRLIDFPLNKLVLVDDTEGSAIFQPQNLIRITPWFGSLADNVLMDQLLPVLKAYYFGNDIPSALSLVLKNEQNKELSIYRF